MKMIASKIGAVEQKEPRESLIWFIFLSASLSTLHFYLRPEEGIPGIVHAVSVYNFQSLDSLLSAHG